MTKGWPNTRCNSGARARARMSVVPAAGKGTTMRTGFVGHAGWAWAAGLKLAAAARVERAARNGRREIIGSSLV